MLPPITPHATNCHTPKAGRSRAVRLHLFLFFRSGAEIPGGAAFVTVTINLWWLTFGISITCYAVDRIPRTRTYIRENPRLLTASCRMLLTSKSRKIPWFCVKIRSPASQYLTQDALNLPYNNITRDFFCQGKFLATPCSKKQIPSKSPLIWRSQSDQKVYSFLKRFKRFFLCAK